MGIDMEAATEFKEVIITANLVEMHFQGPLFTWNNRQEMQDRVLSKLDRFTLETFRNGKPKAFRFYNMWMAHNEFKSLLVEAWNKPVEGNPMFQLWLKLEEVKQKMKGLNKCEFSDISKRVSVIRGVLSNIQVNLQADPFNRELQDEERAVGMKFKELLQLECEFYRQKARIDWLNEGDDNTQFFHNSVKKRQSKNAITRLTLSSGVITTDPERISAAMIEFYSTLLGTSMEGRHCLDPGVVQNGPVLSLEDGIELCRGIMEEEILAALNGIGKD
ncbi:uncharacterized protein [Rutidosis leptorrhynchoides]|uniref:uncharacterized protein n=1 Tax=Rutidosis leptorrhynchoides TaxID=125765 RepID=UPI003A98E754